MQSVTEKVTMGSDLNNVCTARNYVFTSPTLLSTHIAVVSQIIISRVS